MVSQGKLKLVFRCETTLQTFGIFCKKLEIYSFFARIHKILQTLFLEARLLKSEKKRKFVALIAHLNSFFYNLLLIFCTKKMLYFLSIIDECNKKQFFVFMFQVFHFLVTQGVVSSENKVHRLLCFMEV